MLYIKVVEQEVYTLYDVSNDKRLWSFEDSLDRLGANYRKNITALLNFLDLVSKEGPPRNTDRSHKIRGNIWEFIQNSLRVLWFYDDGRIIILSRVFIKKRGKTPEKKIDFASNLEKRYLAAKHNGEIEVVEDEG